jgi:membrane-anchored protein YejM (alkaline phosphatase superfamily)
MAFTHENLTAIQQIDDELHEFMTTWVNSDVVRNTTIVVISSDHGNHIFPSELHSDHMARRLDQKNPILYLLVPPWMKDKYPERMAALQLNAKTRVTTNIDVYNTLVHLLNFTLPDVRSTYGQTLFSPIPKTRTCADMGVQVPFCACQYMEQLHVRYRTLKKL